MSETKRLKELEAEDARLKKLLFESTLEMEISREALRKISVTAPAPRGLLRDMVDGEMIERRALAGLRMGESALSNASGLDRDSAFLEGIQTLADHRKRYGVRMVYLRLLETGMLVND